MIVFPILICGTNPCADASDAKTARARSAEEINMAALSKVERATDTSKVFFIPALPRHYEAPC
jgi:hypothetical protein